MTLEEFDFDQFVEQFTEAHGRGDLTTCERLNSELQQMGFRIQWSKDSANHVRPFGLDAVTEMLWAYFREVKICYERMMEE